MTCLRNVPHAVPICTIILMFKCDFSSFFKVGLECTCNSWQVNEILEHFGPYPDVPRLVEVGYAAFGAVNRDQVVATSASISVWRMLVI